MRKYLKDEAGYRTVFEKVKAMGADAVQISCTMSQPVGAQTLAALAAEYDLPICATHSPVQRITDDLDRLAEEHLTFGCREIGIGMMPKQFRQNGYERLDKFLDILNVAGDRLKAYGMTVAYHNHWFEFDKKDNSSVFDLMIERTEDYVRFIPDTFWIKVGGEEPAEFLKKLSGRVGTVHLKDYSKVLGLPVFRALGKGTLDFGAIINSARQTGAEYAVAELDFSPNPLKSAAVSMQYMKGLPR